MLYRCMWLAEKMLQPTLRNGISSFDDWASRTGLWRDIQRLEGLRMVEVSGDTAGQNLDRVIRLTELGRTMALGGVLPPERWNRGWDGKWRLAVFDIPESARRKRTQLRGWLEAAHFGALQRSVWISPDPVDELAHSLQAETADCGSLTVFEGGTCLGEQVADIVAAAWNFPKVAAAYAKWQAHADQSANLPKRNALGAWHAWGDRERILWQECLAIDPLLPRELWLKDYPGETAWNRRLQLLAKAAGHAIPNQHPG